MEWVKLTDRLPIFDDNLRVLIYTAEHDFNGEQFFDVRATDLYDGPDGESQSEVCAAATHWAERPSPCFYCGGDGEIETDNKGPIVPCPICSP